MNEIDAFILASRESFISKFVKKIGDSHEVYALEQSLFDSAITPFLERFHPSTEDFSKFINTLFSGLWGRLLDNQNYDNAIRFWKMILTSTMKWEKDSNNRVHKGTILYYLGGSMVLDDMVDQGFWTIHKALSEDILTEKKLRPDTPAYKFVTMDSSTDKHTWYGLISYWAKLLDDFISSYNRYNGRSFDFAQFQDGFLKNANIDTCVTFPFVFSIAKIYHYLAYLATTEFPNPSIFIGNYTLGLLFDLSLIIDQLIITLVPGADPKKWQFSDSISYILSTAGFTSNPAIDFIQPINMGRKKDFDKIIRELIEGKYIFPDGTSRSLIEGSFAITFCIRNHRAHYVTASTLTEELFGPLLTRTLWALFYTIELLT